MKRERSETRRLASVLISPLAAIALAPSVLPGQAPPDPFAAVVEATTAARETARRLGGRGTFQSWAGNRLQLNYDFDMVIREDRHRQRIETRPVGTPPALQYRRRVVVRDGPVCFVNRFSHRIRPVGCEMEAYDAGSPLLGVAAGMNLDPARLLETMAGDPARYGENVRLVDTLPNGNLLFTRDLNQKTLVEIEASPAVGFNIVRFETRSKTSPVGFGRYEAEWRQAGDAWYVSRLARLSSRSDGPPRKEEVSLTEVDLDPEERAETFSFGALEPVEGQRLIDRRRGAKVQVRTVKGLTPDQLLSRPAEVAEELPDRYAPAAGP